MQCLPDARGTANSVILKSFKRYADRSRYGINLFERTKLP